RRPLARAGRDAEAAPVDGEEALRLTAEALKRGKRVIGIGSPRASLEANFALRTLVGVDNFYAGVPEGERRLSRLALDIMCNGPARSPSLAAVARADAALVLGEDVTQTAPMLALALRQSARRAPLRQAAELRIPEWDAAGVRNALQGEKGPLYVGSLAGTRLDDVATQAYRAPPDDIARLGFAVANALDAESTSIDGLPEHVRALAAEIAAALEKADEPLVVCGGSCGSEDVLRAAANVAWALRRKGRPSQLCLTAPECNSFGLALLGGDSLEAAFDAVKSGDADTVVILENDLYRRAGAATVDAFFGAADHVIVVDHTAGETTARADTVLPAATFAESDGVFVNNEGRAQRFYKVMMPTDGVRESWRWLRDLALAAGRSDVEAWQNVDGVEAALAAAVPVFAPVTQTAPPADFRIAGLRIGRQPGRYSGRTAMNANISVHEPQPPEDVDSPLAFSMEGYREQPPSPLIPRFWAPAWNSVQALNKFQEEIAGPLRGGDPGRRLIEPAEGAGAGYFTDLPPRVEPPAGCYLVVPAHHIFGSEEFSAQAPGIASLAPQPYAGLNSDDANDASLSDGQEVELSIAGRPRRLPVRIIDGLPPGMIALPVGLAGVERVGLPAWGELRNPRSEGGQAP
ncbi:MAG TPA: molybdopterin-dependent oxidoreductase, partial [Dehalococcoidia bacterium]|nr:molybdopterin-dependent oxidoreductase [Dehalococcoidia bacterium]